jgi:hypothetical protein
MSHTRVYMWTNGHPHCKNTIRTNKLVTDNNF